MNKIKNFNLTLTESALMSINYEFRMNLADFYTKVNPKTMHLSYDSSDFDKAVEYHKGISLNTLIMLVNDVEGARGVHFCKPRLMTHDTLSVLRTKLIEMSK